MDTFITMNKEQLRAACKAAGISYSKLNNDGMRAALTEASKPPVIEGLKIEKNREEQNGIKRPSVGGKCRAIWDALDESQNIEQKEVIFARSSKDGRVQVFYKGNNIKVCEDLDTLPLIDETRRVNPEEIYLFDLFDSRLADEFREKYVKDFDFLPIRMPVYSLIVVRSLRKVDVPIEVCSYEKYEGKV